MATTAPFPAPDRTAKSTAIHTLLNEAAATINDTHARVLSCVIEAQAQKIHRDIDGYSGLRDWLRATFDFHTRTAADLAAIARCANKFTVLTALATTGTARIDLVAAAVRRLETTKALRLYAKTPYRVPVASPFDPQVSCPTPEHWIGEYCTHATVKDVHARLDEIEAALDCGEEILDGLGQDSLQRLELIQLDNGMWTLDATLAPDTGQLFAKYLTTAVPPPRQDETDADGLLPPKANRDAEALHQLIAGYGTSPDALKRHGHTATLDLTVDIQTLQGEDTGRVPLLEGRPISLARARLLACEAQIIPSVFDYKTGEAVELGRAARLPNTALRRKLELEQPEGCAWHGCTRPVAWLEAHHLQHWANGGKTVAENLILLCRFHHGRIHTTGWTIEKTGPGQAVIVHHEGHEATPADMAGAGCDCADYRTDADLDAEHQGSDWDAFPTGFYRSEWSEAMRPDLEPVAEAAERDRCLTAIKQAKDKCREKYGTSGKANQAAPTPPPLIMQAPKDSESTKAAKAAAGPAPAVDYGAPPFLRCPSGRLLGGSAAEYSSAARNPQGSGPFSMPTAQTLPAGPAPTPQKVRERSRLPIAPDRTATGCGESGGCHGGRRSPLHLGDRTRRSRRSRGSARDTALERRWRHRAVASARRGRTGSAVLHRIRHRSRGPH